MTPKETNATEESQGGAVRCETTKEQGGKESPSLQRKDTPDSKITSTEDTTWEESASSYSEAMISSEEEAHPSTLRDGKEAASATLNEATARSSPLAGPPSKGTTEKTAAFPMPQPMPMPLPNANNQPPCSIREIPGAHAVGPTFRGDLAPRTRPVPTLFSASEPGANAPSSSSTGQQHTGTITMQSNSRSQSNLASGTQTLDSNLARATIVDEEIGQAHPVHQNYECSTTPNGDNSSQGNRPIREEPSVSPKQILLMMAVGLVALVVLIVVLTTTNNNNARDSSSGGILPPLPVLQDNNATTLAPSSFLWDLPNYALQVLHTDKEGISPQSKAYQWMLQDPNLDSYPKQRQLQRFALAVFYYAMNGPNWEQEEEEGADDTSNNSSNNNNNNKRELQFDPNGPKPYLFYRGFPLHGCRRRRRRLQPPTNSNSSSTAGGAAATVPQTSAGFGQVGPSGPTGCRFGSGAPWLSYNVHECDWYNQHNSSFHSTCNDQEVFSRLYLSGHGLQGSLPKELAMLTGMERFFVDSNQINGTLPEELFAGWPLIKDFWVRNNQLEGKLSNKIQQWQNLERFNVYGNAFTGTLPDGLYSLGKLKLLALIANQFSGTLNQELLPGLETLRIFGTLGNSFQGSIPTELGLLTNLFSLTMEANQLTGTLPTELGRLTNLEYFAIGKNDLSGTLPSELGQMDLNLTFSIRDNPNLVGSIPAELGVIPIANVFLEGTGLTGEVPSFWQQTP